MDAQNKLRICNANLMQNNQYGIERIFCCGGGGGKQDVNEARSQFLNPARLIFDAYRQV